MSMSMDQRAKRHHEINIFIAVNIPYARSLAAFQQDGSRGVHRGPVRGRIHALDQRLVCTFKPFCRSSPASCLCHVHRICFYPDPARPPPSTTSAVPVTNEDASLAK